MKKRAHETHEIPTRNMQIGNLLSTIHHSAGLRNWCRSFLRMEKSARKAFCDVLSSRCKFQVTEYLQESNVSSSKASTLKLARPAINTKHS